MNNYVCWYCQKDLTNEPHYFSYEFDTPICKDCFEDKLKNPKIQNDEINIIRDEFGIKLKRGKV